MLESLQYIQTFAKILEDVKKTNDINEIDAKYVRLNASIEPLERST
jgi:hypothetical protein